MDNIVLDQGGQVKQQRPMIVYGAGGHGVVVAEAATAGGWEVSGFVDDDRSTSSVNDWPVRDPTILESQKTSVIIAIGENQIRQRLVNDLLQTGHELATVIHPTAWVSPTAKLGVGVFVGPQAVVHSRAQINHGAIVNSAAVVEHDSLVGPFAHVGPNTTLGARVMIKSRSLIGLNAVIRSGICIGSDCMVGAGAVVVKDVADGLTVVGIPAAVMKEP